MPDDVDRFFEAIIHNNSQKAARLIENIKVNPTFMMLLKAILLASQKKTDKAIALVDEVLKNNSSEKIKFSANITKIAILLKSKRFSNANVLSDNLIRKNRLNHTVLEYKGAALYGLRRYREALPFILKAVKLNRNCTNSLQLLVLCYAQLKKEEKASEVAIKLLGLDPLNKPALWILFYRAYESKRYKIAMKFINKIISVDKGHTPLEYKGNILLKQNKLKQAELTYFLALKKDSTCSSLLTNYAIVEFKLKNYFLSLNLVNKALEYEQTDPKLMALKIDILEKKRMKKSLIKYIQIVKKNKDPELMKHVRKTEKRLNA